MPGEKPTDTVVLDAGPIIKNDPAVSSLLAQADHLVTIPAVISEIRDVNTRSRVETLLKPFLTLRDPRPQSLKTVTDFARRTGDLAVLSRTDLQIIALAYELECEKNGGNWRLRSTPGQAGINGPAPESARTDSQTPDGGTQEPSGKPSEEVTGSQATANVTPAEVQPADPQDGEKEVEDLTKAMAGISSSSHQGGAAIHFDESDVREMLSELSDNPAPQTADASNDTPQDEAKDAEPSTIQPEEASESTQGLRESDEDDSDGWITPSNIKKHQSKDANTASTTEKPDPRAMRVATITTDFAMQNVLMQMNLTLLSTSFQQIRRIKTFALRCHACFYVCKEMGKQFCPRCGGATLRRIACSTDAKGQFHVHLSNKFQWNNRGNRYSVPKPTAGSSNPRKRQGGGKGGWGRDLILAEDQKEYTRAVEQEKRMRRRDLMDEDYLPGILTGEKQRQGGKPKVGAGRNVNSKKR